MPEEFPDLSLPELYWHLERVIRMLVEEADTLGRVEMDSDYDQAYMHGFTDARRQLAGVLAGVLASTQRP